MDIRFGGKFEVTIDAPDSLLDYKTLKMVLQPVVENAIYHGLEQKNGKGTLVIRGYLASDGSLEFVVDDNGKGMSGMQLSELHRAIQDYENIGLYCEDKRSIGLSNINKRIKLQFGGDYGLTIVSEEKVGTKVTIRLPVLDKGRRPEE